MAARSEAASGSGQDKESTKLNQIIQVRKAEESIVGGGDAGKRG